MKKKKILILILIFSFLFILSILLIAEEEKLIFYWAFLYKNTDKEIKTINYDKLSADLSTGDEVKIYLKPVQNIYIYLFLHDTDDLLYLLFPQRKSHFKDFYELNKEYYFPTGAEWSPLDETEGIEKFILLASETRLVKLEELTEKYMDHLFSHSGNEERLKELKQKVLEEIKRLKLVYSTYRSIKEEIVVVAGKFRGSEEKIEFTSVKIETEEFYARTIKIKH